MTMSSRFETEHASLALREWLLRRRHEAWRARLRADHGLDGDEMEELAPYITFVSHYGFRKGFAAELAGGVLLAVALVAATVPVITALVTVPAFVLLLRWFRRTVSRSRTGLELRDHLEEDPRRILDDDGVTPPIRREEIEEMDLESF